MIMEFDSKLFIKQYIWQRYPKLFFFYQDFLSQTLAIRRTAGEGRGPSFIPLCQSHPLTNVQTFICNFAGEMTITYFLSHRLYLPDCYSIKFTTLLNYHLIDWWCNVTLFICLFTWLFDSKFLLQQFDTVNRWI